MGRSRDYTSNAERQRAYRRRKAKAEVRLREQLQRRRLVSARLVKVLGLLGSDHSGERDNAARLATRILKEANLTWYDVLGIDEEQ
jgi:hypothetical protein